MFKGDPKTYPVLKGKAAEIRHVGQPLLDAFTVFMDSSSVVQRQIKLALECSVRFEEILDENITQHVLPWAAHLELVKVTFGMNQCITSKY